MDHIVSHDLGRSWDEPETCYLKEGIRNPQTAQLDGVYLLHGRNAAVNGFVIYTSKDGVVWDEGYYIAKKNGLCYYSNNIVLNKNGKNRLLIQYSQCYASQCVNVWHRWLEIK